MTRLPLLSPDRRRILCSGLAYSGLAFVALPQAAFGVTPAEAAASIAPGGTLRAAINYGNPVLARKGPDGTLDGITVRLAAELARRLSLPLSLVPYDAAGKVSTDATTNAWDVAFMAIDPERAKTIAFTAPYLVIDSTYMVPKDSPYHGVADLDKPGVKIVVARGAAYDLYLTRTLKQAMLVRTDTPAEAIALYYSSHADGLAGVRAFLEDGAKVQDGARVLPDAYARVDQAMAMPQGRDTGLQYLRGFVEDVKANGFVRQGLDANGQKDVAVASPG